MHKRVTISSKILLEVVKKDQWALFELFICVDLEIQSEQEIKILLDKYDLCYARKHNFKKVRLPHTICHGLLNP